MMGVAPRADDAGLPVRLALGQPQAQAPVQKAEARTRVVYVNDYDVVWRHGRPFYRVTREPVYVVRNYRSGPRYYYYANYDRPYHRYGNRYHAYRDHDNRYYYRDGDTRVRITYDSDYDDWR